MAIVRQLALWLALPWLVPMAWAADTRTNEVAHRVKAAYLYKFATYVEWPQSAFADAGTPMTIGVVGADEVAAELSKLREGRQVHNRALEVRTLKPGERLAGLHILFIGRPESGRLKRIVESIEPQPVLTVTESDGALGAGSVINFVAVEDNIRFEVSLARAERNGLKISARLLSVAQKVEPRGP